MLGSRLSCCSSVQELLLPAARLSTLHFSPLRGMLYSHVRCILSVSLLSCDSVMGISSLLLIEASFHRS